MTAQTIVDFAPATPIIYSPGTSFALTATGGTSGNPVVFASSTSNICTVAGSTASVLRAGTCSLTANQAGNANYAAAAQRRASVVINKVSQTLTFNALASQVFGTPAFTVTASASSGLAPTFTSGTTTVCTVSSGKVTLKSVGTCTITASQAGDTNTAAAIPVPQSFAVTQGSQTISFGTPTAKTFGGAAFTVSATASSALVVAMTSNTPAVCTVAAKTVTLVGAGTCSISANQAGNANYKPATQVIRSFTVSKAAQTISFDPLVSHSLAIPSFVVSAVASSGLPVAFTSTTTTICTVAGTTVTLLKVGTCSLTASQAGNASYSAAVAVVQSFGVTASGLTAQAITNFTPATPIAYSTGKTVTLSATGGASGNPIAFATTTPAVCTVAGTTATLLSAGTCTVTANQAGNATYAAAPQRSANIMVNRGPQTIAFGMLANQRIGADPFPISATASSGLTVFFASTTPAVCSVAGNSVTPIAPGTCSISANQTGSSNFAAAPQVIQSFQIGQVVMTMAVGYSHACALTNAGGVKCWGSNAFGQLGDGSTTDRTTPVDVSGLSSGVAMIEAGYGHTCAITNVGSVKCWGDNYYGQLGDGTTTQRNLPTNVVGLPANVISITAGGEHSCALQDGDMVSCWGANDMGQLGDNTGISKLTPVTVGGLNAPIRDVRAGHFHTCTLALDGGAIQCWGRNDEGQLGDGTTNTALSPVNVSGLAKKAFSAVEGAISHTCALTTDGATKCWGSNTEGQLGDGSRTASLEPIDVSGMTSGTGAIAASDNSSCALSSDGGLKCWGAANLTLIPTDVPGMASGVREVGIGHNYACAISASNAVLCWGDNANGQLGDGSTMSRSAPAFVSGLSGGNASNQVITFNVLPGKTITDPPFTITATATSGLAVAFLSITPGICTVSGVVVTAVSIGTCTISANQRGNTNYNAAPQAVQSFNIRPPDPGPPQFFDLFPVEGTIVTAPFVIVQGVVDDINASIVLECVHDLLSSKAKKAR